MAESGQFSGGAFRERARQEADRYGPDPWIFARELLQNARDAGATTVRFSVFVDEARGEEVVACDDDGEGMTFAHARRYLFSLYASSKEKAKNQVGKFGVGFWSVLRFEPSSIVVRSWPRQGEPWGVCLDGSLDAVTPADPPARLGTQVVLRRPRGDGGLARRIHDAVWQSARFLHQRDDLEAPLRIEVNGRFANDVFALPAPSASFRRRGLRGVVGLGSSPRVELFSRGLRVRSAACLEDLASPAGSHSGWMRVRFSELLGGVAPVALLESAELELMLARSDARDTRALGRLVRLAQREQQRLIERQLRVARPLPAWRALGAWLTERLRLGGPTPILAGLVLVLVAIGLVRLAPPARPAAPAPMVTAMGPPPVARSASFEDLGPRYLGPDVEELVPNADLPATLQYSPATGRHHFAALRFSRLGADGSPVRQPRAIPAARYRAPSCAGDSCVQVALALRTRELAVRIPVPTGHRVVAGSVRLAGHRPALRASTDAHPTVVLEAPAEGLLRYQTVAAADPTPFRVPAPPRALPAELVRRARQLRSRPVPERVAVLRRIVQRRVAYDRSPETTARHREARDRGQGFLTRTLAIGKGDCDVQNGLFTALLHAAGVPARLAVGYLGLEGRVLPWMHAWVEVRHQGRWKVADATVPEAGQADSAAPLAVGAGLPPQLGLATAPSALGGEPGEPETGSRAPEGARVALDEGVRGARGRWLLVLGPLGLVGAGLLAFTFRTRRAFTLDGGIDLSRLLAGVLQQPAAFSHIGALFFRPIVPLAGGGAISLLAARDLARRGRLYGTRVGSELAESARRKGAVVIDWRLPEGRTVADALGAVDLDRWGQMLDAARGEPLLEGPNRLLRRHGEALSILTSSAVAEEAAVIDLGPLGRTVPGVATKRLILVHPDQAWIAEARARHATAPETASFLVLDGLARRLDLPSARRRRLLGEAAQAAILASFAQGPR